MKLSDLFEVKVDEDMPEEELYFVLNGKVILRITNIEKEKGTE